MIKFRRYGECKSTPLSEGVTMDDNDFLRRVIKDKEEQIALLFEQLDDVNYWKNRYYELSKRYHKLEKDRL